jgi:hypothetical protein
LFGTPHLVDGISTPSVGEGAAFITSDERELFFEKYAGEGIDWNIYVARRNSKDTPFGQPVPVSELNNPTAFEGQPGLSADGLTMYYVNSDTPQGEIWTATRPASNQPFAAPELLFNLRPDVSLTRPSVTSNGRSLYVQYRDVSGSDAEIYVSQRDNKNAPWGELAPVPELSDPNRWAGRPFVSADDLLLFIYDDANAANGRGGGDLSVLIRPSIDAPWSSPVNLGSVINTGKVEDYAMLAADGSTLYFTRYDILAGDDISYFNSADIWQSAVLSFEAPGVAGNGGAYVQDFDAMGSDAAKDGTSLPTGWTFTANDIVFNNATTERFPALRRNYAGVYSGGSTVDDDRALVTDYALDEGGELDFRAQVQEGDLQALRLGFDLEVWQVFPNVGNDMGEAAFHVVLEADSGNGFSQVADLGTVTTGSTLARPATGSVVNGNDPAYRVTYDSGPLDVDVPQDATLRVRWVSTDVAQQKVVFGLDNVSLRFAAPGDANIDGIFNSADLIDVLANGEYEDTVAGNSTWSEGDWDNDNDFNSTDLIEALASGGYVSAATLAAVPEPTGAALLLGGLALALRARRSRYAA